MKMNKMEFERLLSKGEEAWFRKCREDGVLYADTFDENGDALELDPQSFGYDF